MDCTVHYSDTRGDAELKAATSIFITEGDSAAGSITKIRNVKTQAVFSLRGKPQNTYGLTQKVVYENDEFNLLQAALNIEDGIDGLRYNNVIIATDADVDGMHIRLLLITFFLQFFPDLIRRGHLYVLQTPLFRVRDKNKIRRGARGKGAKKTTKQMARPTQYTATATKSASMPSSTSGQRPKSHDSKASARFRRKSFADLSARTCASTA